MNLSWFYAQKQQFQTTPLNHVLPKVSTRRILFLATGKSCTRPQALRCGNKLKATQSSRRASYSIFLRQKCCEASGWSYFPEVRRHLDLYWFSPVFPGDLVSVVVVSSCHIFEERVFESILIIVEPQVPLVKFRDELVKPCRASLAPLNPAFHEGDWQNQQELCGYHKFAHCLNRFLRRSLWCHASRRWHGSIKRLGLALGCMPKNSACKKITFFV